MKRVKEYHCYDYSDEWYLIEMLLERAPREIDFGAFVVPEAGVDRDNRQTAYLEQYLNESGTEKICALYDVPREPMPFSRVAFFVCKVGADTLQTPFGDFPLHADTPAPSRLRNLIEMEED